MRRPAASTRRPRFSADQPDPCGSQVVRRRGVQQEVGSERWFGTKTQRSLDAMARLSASPIHTSNQPTIPLASSFFFPFVSFADRCRLSHPHARHRPDGSFTTSSPRPSRPSIAHRRKCDLPAAPTCASIPPRTVSPRPTPHESHLHTDSSKPFFPGGGRSRFRGGSEESNRRPRGGKRNRYVSERGFDPRTCGLLIHSTGFMGPPRFHCATPMHGDTVGGCVGLCR